MKKLNRWFEGTCYAVLATIMLVIGCYACSGAGLGEICDGGTCTVNVNFNVPQLGADGGTTQTEFTPKQLSNLELWLRADKGVSGVIGSATIVGWKDQSTNAYDYNLNGMGSSLVPWPAIILDTETTAFNELPAIALTAYYGSPGLTTSGSTITSSAATIVVAVAVNLYSTNLAFINTDTTASNIIELGTNSSIYADSNISGLSVELSGEVALPYPSPFILAVTAQSGGQYVLYVNGVPVASTVVGSFSVGLGISTIGYYSGFNSGGDIAEAIEYSRVLSPTELDQVNAYLMNRYAITP